MTVCVCGHGARHHIAGHCRGYWKDPDDGASRCRKCNGDIHSVPGLEERDTDIWGNLLAPIPDPDIGRDAVDGWNRTPEEWAQIMDNVGPPRVRDQSIYKLPRSKWRQVIDVQLPELKEADS